MDLLYNVQCTYTESPHKIRSAPLATALGALSSWSSYWSSDLTLRSYCIGLFGFSLLSYWSVGSYWPPWRQIILLLVKWSLRWLLLVPFLYSLFSYWSSDLSLGSYWPAWLQFILLLVKCSLCWLLLALLEIQLNLLLVKWSLSGLLLAP